jgi:undecaprenyl-diphosphatase
MGGYVGRHPAAPFLMIAAGCSCLFAAIAAGVLAGGPLARFDRRVVDALHAHASGAPSLTDAVRVVGAPGSLAALALVSALVAMALLAQRRWSAFTVWLVAVLGGEALNLLLKDLFARPRPRFERPLVVEASHSFPSGQAMESLVVYGMLAYFAVLILRGTGKHAFVVRRGGRAGGPDRVRKGVPWRSLPQRRGGRVCCGGRMAGRRHRVLG